MNATDIGVEEATRVVANTHDLAMDEILVIVLIRSKRIRYQ